MAVWKGVLIILSCYTLNAALVFADNSGIQCFVPGECLDSQILDARPTNTSRACLNLCQSLSGCEWFTWYIDSKVCTSLSGCLTLTNEKCEANCISGETECPEIQCGIQGQCYGALEGIRLVGNEAQCNSICDQREECKWYSYSNLTSSCTMTNDCPALDRSCDECLASEKACMSSTEGQVTEPSLKIIYKTTSLRSFFSLDTKGEEPKEIKTPELIYMRMVSKHRDTLFALVQNSSKSSDDSGNCIPFSGSKKSAVRYERTYFQIYDISKDHVQDGLKAKLNERRGLESRIIEWTPKWGKTYIHQNGPSNSSTANGPVLVLAYLWGMKIEKHSLLWKEVPYTSDHLRVPWKSSLLRLGDGRIFVITEDPQSTVLFDGETFAPSLEPVWLREGRTLIESTMHRISDEEIIVLGGRFRDFETKILEKTIQKFVYLLNFKTNTSQICAEMPQPVSGPTIWSVILDGQLKVVISYGKILNDFGWLTYNSNYIFILDWESKETSVEERDNTTSPEAFLKKTYMLGSNQYVERDNDTNAFCYYDLKDIVDGKGDGKPKFVIPTTSIIQDIQLADIEKWFVA